MNKVLQKRIERGEMPWKDKIRAVVRGMAGMEQVGCPLKHYFLPGIYIREIFMPAGTVVVGKTHKTRHHNIIQSGHVSLIGPDGTTDLHGPHTFVSEAGVQKTLYIHTDCTWSTIHLTDLRDMESLEAEVIEADDSYPAFERAEERLAIARAAITENNRLLEN